MAQLQNIPSRSKPKEYDERIQKMGPLIREMFAAPPPDVQEPDGYDLIVIDKSQLELRLGAHFTGDPTLLKVYREKVEVLGFVFYTGDIHHETMVLMKVPRKLAKNLNFGLFYGMGAENFARYASIYYKDTTEYDIPTAAKYVEDFHQKYATVFNYHEELRNCWWNGQRSFELISGRMRHFPRNAVVSPGTIYNSKIQGSAGDVMKADLWALENYVLNNPEFKGLIPLIQVHDEFVFQVPKRIALKAAVMVKFVMEYPWFNTAVPILASAKICQSWADKDRDAVPEVGTLYVEPEEGEAFTCRAEHDWDQYVALEEAKKIKRKSCVAMLSQKQSKWARSLLPAALPTFGPETSGLQIQTVEEYLKEKADAQ